MTIAEPQIFTIPCLQDNYAFVIFNPSTKSAAIVDVPEAEPILAKIKDLGAETTEVFLTHHHWDHIDGLSGLNINSSFKVIGAKADENRLPDLDTAVIGGNKVKLAGFDFQIFDVSGHTVGHIAAYSADLRALFSADSLMAMGCGRLFEGTPAQMWDSMQKLRNLPKDTMVYSGHEYMAGNMAFALSLESQNADLNTRAAIVADMKAKNIPTVPSLLSDEILTNPFLRADDPILQKAVNMFGADPAEVFAEIRSRKDNF